MSSVIVDIHCHNFNADDIPVRGFVDHVIATMVFGRFRERDPGLGWALARLADRLMQGGAPGYEAEKADLERRLREGVAFREDISPTDLDAELDEEAMTKLQQIAAEDPYLVDQAAGEWLVATTNDPQPLFITGRWQVLKDFAKFALLLVKRRLKVTSALIANFANRVDLFCPLLVDLGTNLKDDAETTVWQQVELQDLISQLSMRGLLPGRPKAHVHPFVGFDPLRELKARKLDSGRSPLEVVKDAVVKCGSVGVKLYPPMGWRPLNNVPQPGISWKDARTLDRILRDFYGWCQELQVPITAHASHANYSDYRGRDQAIAGPGGWIEVLNEFPDLHLNLGHFGGFAPGTSATAHWPLVMSWAAGRFTNLFADVSNHEIEPGTKVTGDYLAMIKEMFSGPDEINGMRDRLMFGSDWFMLVLNGDAGQFLDDYEKLYLEHFGREETAEFLGARALRFLGFDDPANKNAKRLRDRYEAVTPGQRPAWVAAPS